MIGSLRAMLAASLAVALCSAMPGCATRDKLSYDHFEQIRPNASDRAEVKSLIGEPSQTLGGDTWIYIRSERQLHAIIDFDASGRVARKQWVDAMSADKTWVDSGDKPSTPKP